MPDQKPLVLILPKWWPDPVNFHNGIFFRKQAMAVKPWYGVACVYVHGLDQEFSVADEDGILTVRIGVGEKRGPLALIRKFNAVRKAYKRGYMEVKQRLGRPSLVHAQGLLRPGFFAWWMRLVLRIPYVVGEQWSGYITGEYQGLGRVKRWLTRKVVRGSRRVFVPSGRLRDAMTGCGLRGKYVIVPNVVENVADYDRPPRVDDKIRVMNLSDLWDEKKNVSGLIRAVANVSRQDPRFELHLVGDGSDRDQLRSVARDERVLDSHVFFRGEMPNQEVYNLMKTMDFYITNSHVETFSMATAEAIAVGIPVISTDCGGPSEFVTEEVGILIPIGDQPALEEAMVVMASSLSKFDRLKLMSYARSRFSYDVVGRLIARVYDDVI